MMDRVEEIGARLERMVNPPYAYAYASVETPDGVLRVDEIPLTRAQTLDGEAIPLPEISRFTGRGTQIILNGFFLPLQVNHWWDWEKDCLYMKLVNP